MNPAPLLAAMILTSLPVSQAEPQSASVLQNLDGHWLLATDPSNQGREQEWFRQPRQEALSATVPWIIQDAFPGYHGVAWYWRSFHIPPNPHPEGRSLIRFWAVDYKADVWVNGIAVGGHEGGETPFVLDITDAAKADAANLVAVRVLNPTNERIDGLTLAETPHRNKVIPYSAGASYNHGGIVDSVELLLVPAVRVEDVFVRPDRSRGLIRVLTNLRNASTRRVHAKLELTVSPADGGETLTATIVARDLDPGDTPVESTLPVQQPRLWDLRDPYLYRVTARVASDGSSSLDERSVRCGFRDFRFVDGYFRLNDRRIYLRSSHTGNHCPVGLQLPPDPDMLRRDLLNVKVMGFNTIRFISGVATRAQLDLCDEIGLMVYEEPYAAWLLADSPQMKERFNSSFGEMIRRDRNHASVVMWGLLNETSDGPVFRHAVASLPLVRTLDDTRLVMLNSGRFDNAGGANAQAGLELWRRDGPDPNVSHNATNRPIAALGITWAPGQLALHPGPRGEFSAVRWTCVEAGDHEISAAFASIAGEATTDVHVLHNGRSLDSGFINLDGNPGSNAFTAQLLLAPGDRVDFAVGFGNGDYGGDTTALAATIRSSGGKSWDAADQFSLAANPNGPWSYGWLAAGAQPDPGTFKAYAAAERLDHRGIGSLCNPGGAVWEDVLSDQHPYQRVPHTAEIVQRLRTLDGGANPVFLSEYGIGSAVDLVRVTRHYEGWGKWNVEDAVFYRDKLDLFLADWNRWALAEAVRAARRFLRGKLAEDGWPTAAGAQCHSRQHQCGRLQSDRHGRPGNERRGPVHHLARTQAGDRGCALRRLGPVTLVPVCRTRPVVPRWAREGPSCAGQRRRAATGHIPGPLPDSRAERTLGLGTPRRSRHRTARSKARAGVRFDGPRRNHRHRWGAGTLSVHRRLRTRRRARRRRIRVLRGRSPPPTGALLRSHPLGRRPRARPLAERARAARAPLLGIAAVRPRGDPGRTAAAQAGRSGGLSRIGPANRLRVVGGFPGA